MSARELRSGIDEYAGEDLGRLSDAAVEEGLAELELAAGSLEAERLRWVAQADRRKVWQASGHTCMESWMADRLGLGRGAANRVLHRARALGGCPRRGRRCRAARSRGAMEVLVAAREGRESAFARDEDRLVA